MQHRPPGYLAVSALVIALCALSLAAATPAPSDTYEVFARPTDDPDDGARSVEIDPAAGGGAASPFGWHDTNGAAGPEFTVTRGNNAHAYTDVDANNLPDAGSAPDGGAGLEFSFPLDLGAEPSTYRNAVVTNAFYWCNIIHDVLYQHGFDEASGNFQENNYGRGGTGGDPMLIEVQDGSFTNGATISVSTDGIDPRIQIAVFTQTTPARDSGLSTFVIANMYARAVAARLVGDPASPSCLSAAEPAGMWRGWADWIAVVLTSEASDVAATPRPVGTYIMGQPPDGPGIRIEPYTTDTSVNALTYGSITAFFDSFAVGTVWATMLWEVYWALVDAHGFNPDIYGDWTTGGNNLALRLVLDGLKLAPCNPGFVQGRDAILAADQALTGGANQCRIWQAFASRGLGASASQGSNSSTTDGDEAFDLPGNCVGTDVGDPRGEPDGLEPAALALGLGGPNPFTQETRVTFALPRAGIVRLAAYDSQGRLVARLLDGQRPAGAGSIVWSAREEGGAALPSGVYLLRLEAGGEAIARKVTLAR